MALMCPLFSEGEREHGQHHGADVHDDSLRRHEKLQEWVLHHVPPPLPPHYRAELGPAHADSPNQRAASAYVCVHLSAVS